MVFRNGVVIMLSQLDATGVMRPNRLADPEGSAWDAYIWIDDADALARSSLRASRSPAPSAISLMAAVTSRWKTATGIGCASVTIWAEPEKELAKAWVKG